jgi:exonuclease III
METVTSHSPKPPILQITKTSCSKLTKNRNLNCKIPSKIHHQNIRGLRCKTNKLIGHLYPILPLMLCFTEHHAHWEELQQIFMYEYKLAAYFCRTSYAKGGVCMYVHKSLKIESVDIENYCTEKDFEACAIKLNLNSTHICTITTCRAPSGNFNLFINNMDSILRNLYNPALELIICGDINIDYLKNTDKKNQLENLLLS